MMTSIIAAAGMLTAVPTFGTNPGALDMYEYVPSPAPGPNAPLVVFMHGCTQTAEGASHAGWSELADEYGFYVVYPQQRSDNNPIQCFNWAGEYGDPANLMRGMGENESIKEMVDQMKSAHSIDSNKVYVAGFSAGAAFAVVMMATWPDVFKGAAIMSGIPYHCATTVNEAYSCQQLSGHAELKHTAPEWGDLVRGADPGFSGPWPRIILFHGTSDYTVQTDAADELDEQWTNVLGTDLTADEEGMVGMHTWKRYEEGGQTLVESWRIAGMGHAVSMGSADPDHPCAPMGGGYVEDRGLCAAWRSAVFLGLTGGDGPGPGTGPGSGTGSGSGTSPPPGAPSVSITSPSDGDDVSGVVTIEADADDGDGIARVEFFVDDSLKGSDGSAPYEYRWQTANADDGSHSIKAVAYDIYEVSNSAEVEVTLGGGGGGNGALGPDPIPCGCAATGGRARGVFFGALAQGLLAIWLITRRKGA